MHATTPRRPTGRPRGEVRTALARWAEEWAASGQSGGLTFIELVAVVPGMRADSSADRRCVSNTAQMMVRAGELVTVGTLPIPGARRPGVLYAPAPAGGGASCPAAGLQSLMARWQGSPDDTD